jgi:hypothetical protein
MVKNSKPATCSQAQQAETRTKNNHTIRGGSNIDWLSRQGDYLFEGVKLFMTTVIILNETNKLNFNRAV